MNPLNSSRRRLIPRLHRADDFDSRLHLLDDHDNRTTFEDPGTRGHLLPADWDRGHRPSSVTTPSTTRPAPSVAATSPPPNPGTSTAVAEPPPPATDPGEPAASSDDEDGDGGPSTLFKTWFQSGSKSVSECGTELDSESEFESWGPIFKTS